MHYGQERIHPLLVPSVRARRVARRKQRRWLLGITFIATAAMFVSACWLWKPYCQVKDHLRNVRELDAKLAMAKMRRDELKRQIALMHTPAGLEIEARNLGYIRDGERPIQPVFVKPRR